MNVNVNKKFVELTAEELEQVCGGMGEIGLGSGAPSASQRIFTQGSLQNTENPTDVGIQGEGFFRVTMPDGTTAYTRDGSFKLDSNRQLVTSDGYPLADIDLPD